MGLSFMGVVWYTAFLLLGDWTTAKSLKSIVHAKHRKICLFFFFFFCLDNICCSSLGLVFFVIIILLFFGAGLCPLSIVYHSPSLHSHEPSCYWAFNTPPSPVIILVMLAIRFSWFSLASLARLFPLLLRSFSSHLTLSLSMAISLIVR